MKLKPKLISNLEKAIHETLPGKIAHAEMMVRPFYNLKKHINPRHASVLILLFPENNEWHFFLTKRTKKVKNHKGQVSLPGGSVEDHETFQTTAIRETYEEIGVQQNNIKIIGGLTSLFVPVSGYEIHPFIGWISYKPKLIIQDFEVSKVTQNDYYNPMKHKYNV